jgi:perosamine synthetase
MIPTNEPLLAGRERQYVLDCVESGWISSAGSYIERFERDWATYCGMAHGIAVSNGTTALQVAVDALKLGPGDEVIMPSFTIISCALAVVRAGATPVLVDCDPHTYCMDLDETATAVTSHTKAIMPIHMYGHPVDMDVIQDLAEKHGLAIIEDAAQAHGCEYHSRRGGNNAWRRCGGLGTISTFSFFANKLVTTGEGGMVLTNDSGLAERSRSLRNLCFQPRRFFHEEMGYNYRLTNLQAAIGVAQVERMDDILARKRHMGERYNQGLAGIDGLQLATQQDWARINYWMYAGVLDEKRGLDAKTLAQALRKKNIETRPFFLGMHEQPVFHDMGLFRDQKLPVTERIYKQGLYLPSGLAITDDQVDEVIGAVREILS